jgi:primosomal protein N' (replication factor Y)
LRDAITLARPDGQVVLQTTLPHHHTFVAVATNDPTRFYEPELTFRRALGYPPFSHLISLRVSGPSETVVREAATQWAAVLNRCGHDEADSLSVLGPIPATVARIRGRYRWHILVKASNGDRARRCVKETLAQMEASTHRDIKFDVDVDPITFT